MSLLISIICYKTYRKIINQNSALIKASEKLQLTTKKLDNIQASVEVQNKYGKLLKHITEDNKLIEIQALLNDVKAVNASFAFERNINLVFPVYNTENLRFYGNQLRLMQILSGMLHDIIWQIGTLGKIELKINLSDNHNGLQRLVFTFIDNGFYNSLQARDYELSVADIRCKGWTNICALIEQEGGTLEHVHTAYSGNTISLSIPRKIVNNVVSLENYYQDA